MKKIWHASIHLHIYRSEVNERQVQWELSRSWYEGDTVPREGRKYRHVVIDDGYINHPEPIRDVVVLVEEVAGLIQVHAHSAKRPVPASAGRERSGLDHIVPREPLRSEAEATQPRLPFPTTDGSDSELPTSP